MWNIKQTKEKLTEKVTWCTLLVESHIEAYFLSQPVPHNCIPKCSLVVLPCCVSVTLIQ